jgi:hypothetical protein
MNFSLLNVGKTAHEKKMRLEQLRSVEKSPPKRDGDALA